MARTIQANVVAHYAATQTPQLSAAKARIALDKMNEDEFEAVLASMPTEDVKNSDEAVLNKPIQFNVVAEIINITQLVGENDGSSIVECIDVKRKPLAFVVTNKQVGNEERRGFNLEIGSIFEFTLEHRIAGETQFINNETGAIQTHTKDGNGFIKCGKVNRKVFDDTATDHAFDVLIAKATAKPDQFQAILNAGIELQKAKMQFNR